MWPLSYGQLALWHIQRLMPENPVYNVCLAWQVLSELDLVALKQTFQWLVDRHSSLRTTYILHDREPFQIIHPKQKVHFKVHQASDWIDEELESEIDREVLRPFSLEKGPLMRTNLYMREEGRHIGLNTFHHIAVDLMSSSLLFDEIGTLYPAAKNRTPPPPISPPGQYLDFVRWQREMLVSQEGEKRWHYWKQQFPDKLEPLTLPFEMRRPVHQSFKGTAFAFKIERNLTSRILSLSRNLRVTLYTFLLVGFQALLYLYSRQNIFLIRTLTAGRNRPEFERVVGFYANPVIIKADFSQKLTFRQILEKTQKNVHLMIANQDFPFEYLMEKLSFGRDIQYNPNPEIMFTLQAPQKFMSVKKDQNLASPDGIFASGRTGIRLNLGGLVVEKYNPQQRVTLNDLALEMAQVGNELSGAIHYRTDLFLPQSISKLAENYQEILSFMAKNLDASVTDFMPQNGFPQPVEKTAKSESIHEPESSRYLVPKTHTAARNPTEQKLVQIWQEVLNIDHVGIYDDFFKLGGSSLQALQLMAMARDIFQVELSLQQLFDMRIIARISEAIDASESTPRRPPIERIRGSEKLPLSFSQERLWFLDQIIEGQPIHNIPIALRIKGSLKTDIMEKSLQTIVQRHESLRTTFHSEGGDPYIKVAPSLKLRILKKDLSNHPKTEQESEAQRLASEEAQKPFDLEAGPLIRMTLLKLDESEHILLLTMHHIVSDAWSLNIFFHEFVAIYSTLSKGKPVPLPELPVQYSDFAFWQKNWLQGDVLKNLALYWKNRLKNIPTMSLPITRSRPKVRTFRGCSFHFSLSKSLSRRLKALSEDKNVTLFMTLLAAFKALLYRYTRQEDIAIGTPVAGRNMGEIKGLIGCFINVLVLRTDLSGDPGFCELLNRVREEALAAYSHQDLPFDRIVEIMQPKREWNRDPLFQVMFALQDADFQSVKIPGDLSLSEFSFPREIAQYDLTLFMSESQKKLRGMIEYNTDLFDRRTIERMGRCFVRILEGAVDDPEAKLSDLPLMNEREKQKILVDWNDTQRDYPLDLCVHELIEDQVKRTPDAIALEYNDTQMTYSELDNKANQLGHHLGSFRTKSDRSIGVYLDPSMELVISLLGILKTGAAYVPLDPSFPVERTRFMINDAGLSLIVTQSHLSSKLMAFYDSQKTGYAFRVINLDEERERISQKSVLKPKHKKTPRNLAYVMYTSGSTGFPKGVMISHRALANYLSWCCETYRFEEGKCSLHHSSFAFDFSVTSLIAPLIAGQKVVLLPRKSRESVLLTRLESKHDWNFIKLTPVHAQVLGDQISDKTESPMKTLVLGGEALKPEHLASWVERASNTAVYNEYGPTEATVGCTFYRIPKNIHKMTSVPIGRPIGNMRCYILDKNLKPMPVGVPGELHIGGAGLAEGYLNHPDLTAERFIPDPFSPGKGGLLFKSGDLARFLHSGDIEFLGRMDEQVKINGYRIEPNEIATILTAHPAINQAAVLAREERPGEKYLVAYVVGKKKKYVEKDVQTFLRSHIPNYMLPKAMIWLDTLPLTEGGKLDRRSLPPPNIKRPLLEQKYVPPRNILQKQLARIWSDVLGVDRVGIHDNFFDLGGYSLQVLRLVSRIKQTIRINLPLNCLFKAQTISELASFIKEIQRGENFADKPDLPHASLVTLRAGIKDLPALFCCHPSGGGVSIYHHLSRELEEICPIYGIQSRAFEKAHFEHPSIASMAAEYADLIQKKQGKGPYFLLGWSFGAAVALSTASVLEKEKKKIAFLGLLDPWPQNVSSRWPGPSFFDLLHTIWQEFRIKDRLKNIPDRLFEIPAESRIEKLIDWLSSQSLLKSKEEKEFMRQKLILGNFHVRLLEAFVPPEVNAPMQVWVPKSSGSPPIKIKMKIHNVDGDHYSILFPPHVSKLAKSIKKLLLSANKEQAKI